MSLNRATDRAESPLVSVVIPCYNGAKFIAQAIDSALAQKYQSLEVIVVDDGSSDSSIGVVREYGSAVQLIAQRNSGVAAARNAAIEKSSGAFIAFLDQDDSWRADKIAKQVAVLQLDESLALVHTAAAYVDAAGQAVDRSGVRLTKAAGHCFMDLLRHNTITMSSVVLRRDALAGARFNSALDGCDDWDLWLQVCRRRPIAYLDEQLTTIRMHDSNVSNNRIRMLNTDLAVLERVLARERAPDVVAQARTQYRDTLSALANLEYDNGNVTAARAWFVRQGRPRSVLDAIRLAATFLPSAVRRRLQSVYRSARLARR
jgi:glycosyltransferase involved in cell wall biosynthesis